MKNDPVVAIAGVTGAVGAQFSSSREGPDGSEQVMDVSRHKSVDILTGHVRDAELFKDHAGAGLP